MLSVFLVLVDQRTDWGRYLRYPLGFVTEPVHYLADLPRYFTVGLFSWTQSLSGLRTENERLRRNLMVQEHRVQRLAVLEAENVRLRELLNSSARLDAQVVVAEIVGLEIDPNRHEMTLNKGGHSGVYRGQAVVDAHGLIGQITEVGPLLSRMLLITDATHALSAQVVRNGVRAILSGTGHPDRLQLLYVPDTADIQVGDLLVTSGLGRRFPAGYPVAVVTEVFQESGSAFLTVRARPSAQIDRSSHVLLVAMQSEGVELREGADASP